MSHKDKLEDLIEQAELLHRRWFRQLKAIEGEPQWTSGWHRLEALRDLSFKGRRALETQDESMQIVIEELTAFLTDSEKDDKPH